MEMKDYANLSHDERVKRICAILVPMIYRYRTAQAQGATATDKAKTADSRIDPARDYSVSEASRKTGVPRRTLQRWIKKGALHVKRAANGYPRLDKDSLRQIKYLTMR